MAKSGCTKPKLSVLLTTRALNEPRALRYFAQQMGLEQERVRHNPISKCITTRYPSGPDPLHLQIGRREPEQKAYQEDGERKEGHVGMRLVFMCFFFLPPVLTFMGCPANCHLLCPSARALEWVPAHAPEQSSRVSLNIDEDVRARRLESEQHLNMQ